MKFNRRDFIRVGLTGASAISVLPEFLAAEPSEQQTKRGLKILILGGTGFLGPACTEAALARDHKVTHFNSGRTESRRREAGRPSVVPTEVETLFGNRDPNLTADDRRSEGNPAVTKDPNSPKGLSQLAGREWDAVIDTSGYFPRMVRASAELLAPRVKQYLFISSISVYRDNSIPNFDENAALRTLSDPSSEEMGKNYENFGGGKALCEKAAEAAMPGRVTNIRPGYIVGPRDTSGRFIYWPVRMSLGGQMAVPGKPEDPIQLIDVRDLAEWIVHCIENRYAGVFNATGPAKELSMRAMLEGVRNGVSAQTELTWVENAFLASHGMEGQFPLYAAPTGETAGFHRCNISKALGRGLKTRPISDTAKATLAWYKGLPVDVQQRVAPQFAKAGETSWLAQEKELLSKWNAQPPKK